MFETKELYEALEKIAGGYTDKEAPDVMTCTPEEFRGKMWEWSQRVAAAALAKARGEKS